VHPSLNGVISIEQAGRVHNCMLVTPLFGVTPLQLGFLMLPIPMSYYHILLVHISCCLLLVPIEYATITCPI